MNSLVILSLVIGSAISLWLLYRMIKARPDQFSATAIQESLWVLGVLAVLLILLIGLFVGLLRG